MEEGDNGVSEYKYVETKLSSNGETDTTQTTNLLDRLSSPPQKETHHNVQTQNSISSSTSSTSSNHLQEPDLDLRLAVGSGRRSSSSSGTSKENPLTRSSSINGVTTVRSNNSSPHLGRTCICDFHRACLLPAAAEQVQGLRDVTTREMQSMRRIQAKNRLIAKKQRSRKEGFEKDKDKQQPNPPMPTLLHSEVPAWAAASAANNPALRRALLKIKTGGLAPAKRGRPPGQSTTNAPGSFKVPAVPKDAKLVITAAAYNAVSAKPAEPKSENPPKKAGVSCDSFGRQIPSVSATGDGPNGRRVEGFLYAFMTGEVSILCLCHGIFLSPEEFVKHAGGRDVSNPMKHITVHSTFEA